MWPLEIAVRYAVYNPRTEQFDDLQRELSLATNWFFDAHLNKLTAEAVLFVFGQSAPTREDGWRFRPAVGCLVLTAGR